VSLFLRGIQFLRSDVIWVAIGQVTALFFGLLSLKVFTNLLSAEQYSYVALMMAFSAWIWTGIYQPLNQTILRFYPLAESEGWENSFVPYVFQFEKKLFVVVLALVALLLLFGVLAGKEPSFFLLVTLSACMGIFYGAEHGLLSFLLAQRKRKQVALMQSTDGLLRLCGAVSMFYLFSATEYGIATGVVLGGVLFVILAFILLKSTLLSNVDFKSKGGELQLKQAGFLLYFKKMFIVMLLNASVMNLDKWLLFYIIGGDALGKYAAVYLLAIAMTSVIYFFFEMLGFPLIFKRDSSEYRFKVLVLLVSFYTLSIAVVVTLSYYFGGSFLVFMTTEDIAMEHETFTLLILACGLVNLGRLLMVRGLVDKEPNKYWPAYLVLMSIFVTWCLVLVGSGGAYIASQGFVLAALAFVISVFFLNKGMNGSVREKS